MKLLKHPIRAIREPSGCEATAVIYDTEPKGQVAGDKGGRKKQKK